MAGSPDEIRRLAVRLRAVALAIRVEHRILAGQVEDVTWRGAAADAMRGLATERLGALSRAAGQYDDAALALERHAGSVERHRHLLGSAVHEIRELF
jgi:hypothetical protein